MVQAEHHADRAGASAAQQPCVLVPAVAQFLGRAHDPVPVGRACPGHPAEHDRHQCARDPGAFGDIAHGDRRCAFIGVHGCPFTQFAPNGESRSI